MPKQFKVRSDEAHDTAQRLAPHLNTSATAVMETALRRYAGSILPEELPDEAADTRRVLDEFFAAFSARKQPGESSDHTYDEKGLPV